MLVIEDALLGILMATLPLIAGHSSEKSHSFARRFSNVLPRFQKKKKKVINIFILFFAVAR